MTDDLQERAKVYVLRLRDYSVIPEVYSAYLHGAMEERERVYQESLKKRYPNGEFYFEDLLTILRRKR